MSRSHRPLDGRPPTLRRTGDAPSYPTPLEARTGLTSRRRASAAGLSPFRARRRAPAGQGEASRAHRRRCRKTFDYKSRLGPTANRGSALPPHHLPVLPIPLRPRLASPPRHATWHVRRWQRRYASPFRPPLRDVASIAPRKRWSYPAGTKRASSRGRRCPAGVRSRQPLPRAAPAPPHRDLADVASCRVARSAGSAGAVEPGVRPSGLPLEGATLLRKCPGEASRRDADARRRVALTSLFRRRDLVPASRLRGPLHDPLAPPEEQPVRASPPRATAHCRPPQKDLRLRPVRSRLLRTPSERSTLSRCPIAPVHDRGPSRCGVARHGLSGRLPAPRCTG